MTIEREETNGRVESRKRRDECEVAGQLEKVNYFKIEVNDLILFIFILFIRRGLGYFTPPYRYQKYIPEMG